MAEQDALLEKISDENPLQKSLDSFGRKQISRDFPDNKHKLHVMLWSMEILGLSLLGLIYTVVCMLLGHGIYNLLQYQQCFFSIGFGIAGLLLYYAAQTLTLSSICCGIAGLSPFITWLLFGKDSFYFELNVFFWLVLMVAMLHGYIFFYQEVYRRYWPERKKMIASLALQVRLVLYGIVVPYIACFGCFWLLRMNQGDVFFSPMDILFFANGLLGIKILIWIYLAGIVMLLADTVIMYKDFMALSTYAAKK